MIDEAAWGLVPEGLPERIPAWLRIALDSAKFEDDRQRRAYAWAHSLLNEIAFSPALVDAVQGAVAAPLLPFFPEDWDVSAGFIPFGPIDRESVPGRREHAVAQFIRRGGIPTRVGKSVDYTFGVVLGLTVEEGTFLPEFSQLVRLTNGFPIVCERRVVRLESPPHPAGSASSCCFAKPRPGKRYYCGIPWTEGIVVARHILQSVGTTPGTSVPMSGPSPATLADIDAATTIDAAILDTGPGSIPPTASRLNLASIVPIGPRVSVRGSVNQFGADVLRVMDDPHYFGNMVAHRAFIDAHGAVGDSGALVTSSGSGDAIGLYMGTAGGNPPEGIVQLMRQVTEYFDIDLFD